MAESVKDTAPIFLVAPFLGKNINEKILDQLMQSDNIQLVLIPPENFYRAARC